MRRLLGVLLGAAAFYLLAIDQLSPHHLPGLRWLAFSVAAAGTMSIFLSTRFRKIEAACCVAAVAFGLLAVVDIARVGSQAHAGKKSTASVPGSSPRG